MTRRVPDPERFTVRYVESLRQEYDISKQEFARRAGFDEDRWHDITRRNIDPRASTLREFVEVLEAADPNGDRPRRGNPASCEARTDGGAFGQAELRDEDADGPGHGQKTNAAVRNGVRELKNRIDAGDVDRSDVSDRLLAEIDALEEGPEQ